MKTFKFTIFEENSFEVCLNAETEAEAKLRADELYTTEGVEAFKQIKQLYGENYIDLTTTEEV